MPAKVIEMETAGEIRVREFAAGRLGDVMAQFAQDLHTARTFWRQHRALVEADEFPEPFKSACTAPFWEALTGVDPTDPAQREALEEHFLALGREFEAHRRAVCAPRPKNR